MDNMVQNFSSFSPMTQDWNFSMDQFSSQHPDFKYSSLPNSQCELNELDQSSRLIDIFNTYTTLNKFDLPDSNNYPSYNNSTDGSNGCTPTGKIIDGCQLSWQSTKEFTPSNSRKSYYTDSNSFKHSETRFYTRSDSYSSPYKNSVSCTCNDNDLTKLCNFSTSRVHQNTNHQQMYQNMIKSRKSNPHYMPQHSFDSFKPDLSSMDKISLQVAALWDSKKPMCLKILTTQVVSGTIIGKGGKGLNWFRRKSRIDDIHISMPWEVYPGTEYRTILLRGTMKSVVKAVAMTSDLMNHKSDTDFSQGSYISTLVVFPDILLPKIMELKSAYSSKYVSIIPYKEPDFNEIVVSLKGERQILHNILSYFIYLVDQIIGITNYCFISYKSEKQNNITHEKNINKINDNTTQNRLIIPGQQYDIPNLSSSDKSETSNLNLTLNDLAPDDLTSSGGTDGHLRAIDIATSKFTPTMTFNECNPDDLKNSNLFYNSGDGNDLFNTTCCLSSSPLLDQGLPYVNEVSNYPVTVSFSLPSNANLTTLMTNYPQFQNFDLPKDDKGLPICTFTGTFNEVFAKTSAFISEMYENAL